MTASMIDKVEAKYLRKNVPAFKIGDTVDVHVKIVEGDKERVQVFNVMGQFKRSLQSSRVGQYDDSPGEQVGKVGVIQGVAIDDLYRVHVLDIFMSRVVRWDPDAATATQLDEYGSFGTGAGQLNQAHDILITDARNGSNAVVVANSGNGRIDCPDDAAR